jgi:hypothetical protein
MWHRYCLCGVHAAPPRQTFSSTRMSFFLRADEAPTASTWIIGILIVVLLILILSFKT